MYDLFVKYPELKQIMIEKIKEYDDVLKIFFEKTLNSIDFLQGISTEITNELIFSFIPEYHEKDSIIFKQDDIAEKMYIIQNGMIEIYTVMDNGVIFILERLYRGSVINHRSFLL
jgi:CRP-like cAMP-binding protein